MKAKLTAALLGLAWLAPAPARAYGSGDIGTTALPFLQVGPGARQGAMGEAFSGVADDVHSIYYNPAGLANLGKIEVTGSHDQLFQGLANEFAAFSVPLLSWTNSKLEKNTYGVLGFAMYNMNVYNIERRGTTETDSPVNTFGASDFAWALSYAYAIPETGLSFGATAKLLEQNLDSYHANGFAADAGALYRLQKLSIGFGLRNGGAIHRLSTAKDPLPLTLFSGIGYRWNNSFLTSLDLSLPRDNNAIVGVGVEYVAHFTDNINAALRAGYNTRNNKAGGMSGASFGTGVGYYNVMFDFAWVPFGDLGNTFRYSLHVKF